MRTMCLAKGTRIYLVASVLVNDATMSSQVLALEPSWRRHHTASRIVVIRVEVLSVLVEEEVGYPVVQPVRVLVRMNVEIIH